MLRDFGFVTVVDLTVSLLGVMVVLPAVLLLAEQGRLRLPVPRRGWAPRQPAARAHGVSTGRYGWFVALRGRGGRGLRVRCTRCAPSARDPRAG